MSYKTVRKALAQQAESELRCRFCNEPATWECLSALGARCKPCFDEYCRRPTELKPLPAGAVVPSANRMQQWAHRLMARRDAGETLSPAQASCLAAFERRRGMLSGAQGNDLSAGEIAERKWQAQERTDSYQREQA